MKCPNNFKFSDDVPDVVDFADKNNISFPDLLASG
jgi:hypothetical protein